MKAPQLVSERLILRPLSTEHLSIDYVNWLNDIDVYRYLETGGNYTIDDLKKYLEDVERKEMLFWAIHLKENDKHIGNIKIDPINKKYGLGEYGILMGSKEEWGKGYAKEASISVIKYCFEVVNLRKIMLGVVENNIPAFILYKKLGFELEGIYKKHGYYEGKYQDIFRMAIFKNSIIKHD